VPAAVGLVVLGEAVEGHPESRHAERAVLHEVVAERDDDPRRQRQLGVEAGEHRRKRRNDLPENHADHDAGNHDDGDRVDHRRLDLPLQLDVLLDVDRQPLQNRVENTARLARRNHVREQRIERVGELPHRIGQRGAALHRGSRLQDDLGEVLVVFLVAENIEALHERQPGVDHHRELAGEHGQGLGGDLLGRLAGGRLLFLLLGFRLGRGDAGDHDLVTPQRGNGRVHVVRRLFAGDGLAAARSTRVCECCSHKSNP
jgi:hypothetical protein